MHWNSVGKYTDQYRFHDGHCRALFTFSDISKYIFNFLSWITHILWNKSKLNMYFCFGDGNLREVGLDFPVFIKFWMELESKFPSPQFLYVTIFLWFTRIFRFLWIFFSFLIILYHCVKDSKGKQRIIRKAGT